METITTNIKTITAIEVQKNNNKRVNLFLDGQFFVGLDAFVVLQHRLKIGDEIDEATIKQIATKSGIASGFERAIKFLSVRLRSKKEIEQYLQKKGYCFDVIFKIVDKLIFYGYVDELKFATEFVKSYSKKYGKHYIKM
ncbi:MAG: hypothetical protein FWD86_03905, partial [Firmicutes bacterium]|nr:hypothetical protein [Bacillota bacterium]